MPTAITRKEPVLDTAVAAEGATSIIATIVNAHPVEEKKEKSEEIPFGQTEELYCAFEGCDKVLASRWSLKRHIRTHTGEKPFQCRQCSKEFVQKCSLIRHEQTHGVEKAWSCDHPNCNKTFKLKEYLDVHKRTHMKVTGLNDGGQPGGVSAQQGNGAPVLDQFRQRLVRLTIRHRQQLGQLNTKYMDSMSMVNELREVLASAVEALPKESITPSMRQALESGGRVRARDPNEDTSSSSIAETDTRELHALNIQFLPAIKRQRTNEGI